MATPIHILWLEDDEVATQAFLRTLKKQSFPIQTTVISDAAKALDLLHDRHSSGKTPPPTVILLDLQLPGMTGLEFLQLLRQDPILKSHVVFVLTNSERAEDRSAAYQERVAGYFLKHRAGEEYTEIFALLDRYFNLVELPFP
jgi:CheY-like chemotaxis protein